MHGVTSKPLDVYTMVHQYVAIETIIVPTFEVLWILKIGLKLIYDSTCISVIVYKQPWPVTKVHVWADKSLSTKDGSVSYGRLSLDVNSKSFCVPCMNPARKAFEDLHYPASVFTGPYHGSPLRRLVISHSLIDTCLLHPTKDLVRLWHDPVKCLLYQLSTFDSFLEFIHVSEFLRHFFR